MGNAFSQWYSRTWADEQIDEEALLTKMEACRCVIATNTNVFESVEELERA